MGTGTETYNQTLWGETAGVGLKIVGMREDGGQDPNKQHSYGITVTERAIRTCIGLHQIFWVYVMAVRLVFLWTPNNRSMCVSHSFACSWDSSPPVGLPCPVYIRGLLPWLTAVTWFVLFDCWLLKAYSFVQRKLAGANIGKKGGLGEAEKSWERATVRMCWMI